MKPLRLSRMLAAALVFATGCAAGTLEDDAATLHSDEGLAFGGGLRLNLKGFQGAWTDVGVPWGEGMALASWAKGRVDFFVRTGDKLVQKVNTGQGWAPAGDQGWTIVGGLASDPSAVGWAGQNIDIVFRGFAGNVMHVYWNGVGNAWHTEDLGGSTWGKPTIVVAPDGTRMDVFARVGNEIWHRGWVGFTNGWNSWENLGLHMEQDPVAVSWARGHIDIFGRTSSNDIQRFTWDATATNTSVWNRSMIGYFRAQPPIAATSKSPPAVTSVAPGSIDMFIQGADDGIYRNTLNNGTWGGWIAVGGCQLGTPAVVTNGLVNLAVRDKSTNRVLFNYESTSPSWTEGLQPICCGTMNRPVCAVGGCSGGLATSVHMTCVGWDQASHESCVNARHQVSAVKGDPRYNDITFQISAPNNTLWGWTVAKVGTSPPNAQGETLSNTFVDAAEHFVGPPWYINPNTQYELKFYPGGLKSNCAPVTTTVQTPIDPTPACVADHVSCDNDLEIDPDPSSGAGGDVDDGTPCQMGEECWDAGAH